MALALKLMLLTAARRGEVMGAKWEEFDFEKNIWTIPFERVKRAKTSRNIKPHLVPLSPQALTVIEGH